MGSFKERGNGVVARDPLDYVELEDEIYELDSAAKKEILDRLLDRGEGKIRPGHLRLRTLALDLARMFDKMPRVPTGEPGEGAVVVMMSDKVARMMSAVLRAAARADD